jgi:hypothetical protein
MKIVLSVSDNGISPPIQLISTNFQRVEYFQLLNPLKVADVGRCKGVPSFKTGRGNEGVTQREFLPLA